MALEINKTLKTHEVRSRLPNSFSTVPGNIELGSFSLPKNEIEKREQPLINLVQNIIRHTRFIDSHGQYITPNSFSETDGSELISLIPDAPQHLHEDAVGPALFLHDVPILGIVSDYLRFGKEQKASNLPNNQDKLAVSWAAVISSLMQQFTFFDIDGKPIKKSDIKSIEANIFGSKKQTENIQEEPQGASFSETLLGYINQYFEVDIEKGTAQIKDLSALNVSLGSAQRAVTPFSFGNCMEGCRFCYVDRRLSTIVYPNNWLRSLPDIKTILDQYDPETKTGPAQARMAMMDWEPTEHPQFLDIMKAIAHRDPKNQIPVVTHGGSLTEEMLQEIAADPLLKKLLLFQVSLNSANPDYRAKVMAGKGNNLLHHKNAIASLQKMHELKISFDVSIVATTNWIPMQDVLDTITFADQQKPHSYIRVALPTATKDHDQSLLLSPQELANIDNQVVSHREKVKTPIILTVGLLNRHGLKSTIEGVMPESSAAYAGITHGSEIISINGIKPRSRTETTLMLLDLYMKQQKGEKLSCVCSFVLPDGTQKEVDLLSCPQKSPRFLGEKPVGVFGLLLHDDVDFGIFEQVARYQKERNIANPLMVTSEIMVPFFQEALSHVKDNERVNNLTMMPGQNYFFGGNVCIAGLLTFSDILESLKRSDISQKPDALFISSSMISRGGYDLQGYHYQDLATLLGIPVIPLKARTGSI